MAEKKKHTIVSADTGEQVKPSAAAHKPTVQQAAPVGNASGLRIGAIALWVVAFVFEILALQKPNLLIPLSVGTRGDQLLNARSFEAQGFWFCWARSI